MGLGATEESYPQRPGEADCIYYLRIGFCGYGSRCRFNHPCDRVEAVGAVARTGGGEYPERIGQPLCQYYMKIGSCKFGSCFKYNHPGQAKSLAEKNQRDLQIQREQAERHRLAETLDFEIKRWAAGNEGNLRALLSTLHYAKALAEKNQRDLQTQKEQAERHMSCLYL